MPSLLPSQEQALDQAARTARTGYANQAAYSAYARHQANQGFDTQRATQLQRFKVRRGQVGGNAARRGVFNSGIYGKNLGNVVGDNAQALGQIEQGRQGALGGIDLQDNQGYDAYQQSLQDIAARRQAQLQDLAAQLAGLKMTV